uniref:Phosphate transporter n=1 Tax=Physcomitrium patens TaxID=3218 RepID=A0A2K1JCW9_PHYPA|nr:hypothetical protein PHYPA_019652 [Physcomitrium patens]
MQGSRSWFGAVIINIVIRRQLGQLLGAYCELPQEEEQGKLKKDEGPNGKQLTIVYSVFGYMQVLSACFMSFAHGANDVVNAIGPTSAALGVLRNTSLASGGPPSMPVDVLAWGGFGIVAGLLVWGYKVIATIG